MAKNKRLGVSIFVVILSILMAVSVVMTFTISYLFGKDGVSGKLFGSYIYIMETDDMQPELEKGSAIIAEKEDVLPPGSVVLVKNGAREDVMRIQEVVYEEEKSVYRVSADATPDKIMDVTKENVVAKCVKESQNLGSVISFLSSIPGIIVGMILPCFVILAMLIIKIVSMRKIDDEEEEEYDDYDEDDEDDEYVGFNGHKVKPLHSSSAGSPLFNPESDINPSDEFERKKSSIAKNFSQKGTAAQKKAIPESRREPRAAVERFRAAVDEKPRVPVARKSSLVPENTAYSSDEKLEAIKSALSQQQSSKPVRKPAQTANNNVSTEKTATFKAVKEPGAVAPKQTEKPAPKPVQKPAPRPAAPKPAAKPSNASNINSIDDLIKILEEEKKKL